MAGKLTSEPPRLPRRYPVWVCIAMNQLAFPGMGTVMAGRRVGYVQAAIMLAGFFLLMGYFGWLFLCIVRFLKTGDELAWQEHYRQYAWAWQSGLLFTLIAWFWALASSITMWRAAK